ncbi:MAG TPA: hypothetical protein VLT61_05000 [Anaeromyxobacteraceae bacterium]|nr:hypothetical protein [Anaeromyxobacteraceae bacterium]
MIPKNRTLAASWLVLAGLLLLSAGCGGIEGLPTSRAGWLGYRVGGLSLELPEDWSARGDAVHLEARAPGGAAVLKAAQVERPFASEAECLAQAEASVGRGAAGVERGRSHATRLGGRSAFMLEGDQQGWHGWAWAACDGRRQYRVQFMGASPMAAGIAAAQRGVEGSVRFDASR